MTAPLVRFKNDTRGFAAAFAALFLVALSAAFIFFLNFGGSLLIKLQLQSMAELATAAGGQALAEKIAALAEQNVNDHIFAPPGGEMSKYPERFLTDPQRQDLQTGAVAEDVAREVRNYILLNLPPRWPPERFQIVAVQYPVETVICPRHGAKENKKVALETTLEYRYPFAALAGGVETISVTNRSSVPICP